MLRILFASVSKATTALTVLVPVGAAAGSYAYGGNEFMPLVSFDVGMAAIAAAGLMLSATRWLATRPRHHWGTTASCISLGGGLGLLGAGLMLRVMGEAVYLGFAACSMAALGGALLLALATVLPDSTRPQAPVPVQRGTLGGKSGRRDGKGSRSSRR
jgi:hypothetical protein